MVSQASAVFTDTTDDVFALTIIHRSDRRDGDEEVLGVPSKA
jgi:hypothetical protein